MRWFQRMIAAAVLSISTVAATVGASYGQDKVVRIGYQKYGKLVLLKSKGTLEPKLAADGYKVVWTEFPSGPPLLEALNVGAIDFGNTGEAPPIFAQAAGAPIQYVAYEPPAPNASTLREPRLTQNALPDHFWNHIFQRLKPAAEISFLFSIVDSGTGRELQDEPVHSLASLGKSNGERPFRPLARPMTFLPRSTIRLQVIEQTEGVKGALFIVLYGYKVLAAGCPEPVARLLRGTPACPTETIGSPSARVIPFDYVAKFPLTGRPGNRVEDEVPMSVEGGFVATALGYGLVVDQRGVALKEAGTSDVRPDEKALPKAVDGGKGTVNLADLPLRVFPPSALADGLRIRPQFVRLAFENNGTLASALPIDLLDRLFERLNYPDDVTFRYSIFDSARGQDLENRPFFSIAGLGIANGDRPFKPLARPMLFLPRSTIRVDVEERFGRGLLHLVFQGYKILDSSARRP